MRLIFIILLLILVTGCQAIKTPYLEMDVDLASFGTKHVTLPVTIDKLENNTAKLSFNLEAHYSFHAGYKVTVLANENFIGNITYDTFGNPQFYASKEIEYWIHTVDSVNVKSSSSNKVFVNITGDLNTGKFKLTPMKQP